MVQVFLPPVSVQAIVYGALCLQLDCVVRLTENQTQLLGGDAFDKVARIMKAVC
jgi:hypothetical protein